MKGLESHQARSISRLAMLAGKAMANGPAQDAVTFLHDAVAWYKGLRDAQVRCEACQEETRVSLTAASAIP